MNNNETEVNSMPYIDQLFLQCQLVNPVLILWTLIHKFAHRNKRDVNPSSVSVTRFIRSKFSR